MVKQPPRIGLVLGSGAARGWAHIGVIHALNERGIHPDIITGSSVGAIVGAVYASGNLAQFEDWIKQLSRFDIIRLLDARMSGGGLLKGAILINSLRKILGDPQIENLEKPFGCVATELGSGREIWFRSGSLLRACRASISMPGLFAPTQHEHQYLLDGGLVNPVPVSLARAMGAEIIIAVNLNGELVGQHFWVQPDQRKKEPVPAVDDIPAQTQTSAANGLNLTGWAGRIKTVGVQLDSYISSLRKRETPDPGLFDVIVGSVDIMQDRITRSRMVGEPPDIHLTPRVSHIGLLDFDRAEESIDEGRKAVARQEEQLAFLKSLNPKG